MSARATLAVLLWALLLPPPLVWPLEPGWSTLQIATTGSYARQYLPSTADQDTPLPVVVLLHGSGARPEQYERFVQAAADAAGCVLLLPKSLRFEGWDDGDQLTIAEGLRLLGRSLAVDPARLSIAGHSAGGAYAYLLAYTEPSRYAAVFTLAAPFYRIDTLADPRYVAPIRMYYGTDDPNYANAYPQLMTQWLRLGVAVQTDVQPGHGHTTWPESSMEQGLRFLTSHTYAPRQPRPRFPTGRREPVQ